MRPTIMANPCRIAKRQVTTSVLLSHSSHFVYNIVYSRSSALKPKTKPASGLALEAGLVWSGRWGSNPRPPAWEARQRISRESRSECFTVIECLIYRAFWPFCNSTRLHALNAACLLFRVQYRVQPWEAGNMRVSIVYLYTIEEAGK